MTSPAGGKLGGNGRLNSRDFHALSPVRVWAESPDRFGTTIYLTLPEAGDGQLQP